MVLLGVEFVCDLCTPRLGTKSPSQHVTGDVPVLNALLENTDIRVRAKRTLPLRTEDRETEGGFYVEESSEF